MALDLTPEQREIGKQNFYRAVGQLSNTEVDRRKFMKGMLAAGGAVPVSAAAYYGYKSLDGKPVKAALIGAGDEGGVLAGEHNPAFLEFVAVCDIRPYNQERIFTGEPTGPRKGFEKHYGKQQAREQIKVYTDYKEVLARKDIEAVVIALPLHLHAPVAIEAMRAGKHVLCEKLMAWNVSQCKEMIKVAKETRRILSIGHQRHYSLLYAHATEVLRSGVLGDIRHIRAQWHRNNTWPLMDEAGNQIKDRDGTPMIRDGWRPPIKDVDFKALEKSAGKYGYKSVEELVRWRLYNRTGGGLMAELGSHQLDACSIFLGKVHPLAVLGTGVKSFYKDDREVDDHVFVQFEFPGKDYYADEKRTAVKDKNDVVVVTYSSINTNSFEPYGECVMGDRGAMVVANEAEVFLYPEKGAPGAGRSMSVSVTTSAGGKPAIDASSTVPGAAAAAGPEKAGEAAIGGPVSRGYREEMEDFAYCVRLWDQKVGYDKDSTGHYRQRLPRCHGEVAMADAIIALTSNLAMERKQRIVFDEAWFNADSAAVPDPEKKPTGIGASLASR